jgi:hypothetical protein
MQQTLLFLVAATIASLLWLFATGRRGEVETRQRATGYALAIAASSTALYLAAGYGLNALIPETALVPAPDGGLLLLLALAYAAAILLLGALLPDWNSRGHAFYAAFAGRSCCFWCRLRG